MIKHIIFDFDGTIADSASLAVRIFNALAEKYHYKQLTVEEIRLLTNLPINERLKNIGMPLYKVPKWLMECLMEYRVRMGDLKTFEGIHDLLIDLKDRKLNLSIVSSNSVDNIQDFIQKYKLNFFDHVISVKNLFWKHRSIKKYLKQFNLKMDQIIYVGDELRDIQACKKIPVKIISVTWGYDSSDLLKSASPDYIAYKPDDISRIVKNLMI